MKKKTKYDANFTAGGIFFNEFSNLRVYTVQANFEEIVSNDVQANEILAIDVLSSRKRIVSEILRRYQTMSLQFWEFFQNLNEQETKLALFYVCLKTYPIVFDLHFQVTVQKYRLGSDLTEYDIQMRLDELVANSEEVANWSILTIKKINTQYRKALKDAGLFDGLQLIKPHTINDVFWNYFRENEAVWFLDACFK